jgi:hypothetical protein
MQCERPSERTASEASAELRSERTPARAKSVAGALLSVRKNAYRRPAKRSYKRASGKRR